MTILISLIIIVAVVVVALWLVNMIPFPAELQILKFLVIAAIVIVALLKVLSYL